MTFAANKWIAAFTFAIFQTLASQSHAVNHLAGGGEDSVVLAQGGHVHAVLAIRAHEDGWE